MKTSPVLLLLSVALFAARPVTADPLVSGVYHVTVPLGPVLLNGRYPVIVNEGVDGRTAKEGRLDVTTSGTGAISGKIEIYAQVATVTGQIKTRKSGVTLKFKGRTEGGKLVRVKSTLDGTAFTGTVKLGTAKGPARIDVDGVAPAQLDYTLTLTVAENGKLSGTGTLRSDASTQSVEVQGKTKSSSATLRVIGDKTMFEGSGPIAGAGFTAKWKAQALGALVNGTNLPVTRQ